MEKPNSNTPQDASGTEAPLGSALARLRHWAASAPLLLAFGLFSTIMSCFFFEAVFGDQTFLSADTQAAVATVKPLQHALREDGIYPLWTPYVFCGMPSFASMSYTPYAYFPYAIEQLIYRMLAVDAWFTFTLHYVLAGLGVFAFLRRKNTGLIPALTGGFAFMLTPYLITMTVYGHGTQMMTAAYIPWVFWAVDRLLTRVSVRNVGIAALMMGLMLQRAHVQIAYYGLMLAGLYCAWYLMSNFRQIERGRVLPLLGGMAGAVVLAFALAAMLYLPVREYTSYSIRGASSVMETNAGPQDDGVGFDYATQWSFSPGEIMTFVLPSFYGFGGATYWGTMPFTDYPNYMGILVLILALAAFAFYSSYGREQRIVVAFLGFMVLVSLCISFGRNFPSFYRALYEFLPFFNKFRVPVMVLILVQYAVAILAGLGMETILARVREGHAAAQANATRKRWAWRLIIISAGIGITLLLMTSTRNSLFELMRGFYPDKYPAEMQLRLDALRFEMLSFDMNFAGALVMSALLVLALALLKKIRSTHAAVILCLLAVVDLWRVDVKLGKKYPKAQASTTLQPDQIAQFLQADSSLFRIYPAGELFAETRWSALGFQSVGGYHAAKLRSYQDFVTAMDLHRPPLPELANHHIIDMINAKYVLTLANLPDTVWIPRLQIPVNAGAEPRQLTVYENPTVLPRAYLAGEYEVVSDPLTALRRLRSAPTGDGKENSFDPHQTVLLDEIPEFEPEPDSLATVEILQYGLHQVDIEVKSAFPQFLVLSDNYYPAGWQAYIDGGPVKTYRANYCFRAVGVPAGKHMVEFRYQSATFKTGVWISIVALALCLACLFIDRPKENNRSNSIATRDAKENLQKSK